MTALQLELDHVGVAVPDLEAGHKAFARLGFQLTPRSLHQGSLTPGGPIQPWGSGNHCAMFEWGYLEVIGLTDPGLPSSVKDLVARHTGLHILALGCTDAKRTYDALAAAGAPVEPVRALERDAAFGPGGGETRRARFRNLYVDRRAHPEARILFIEHDTPEVLWQPHLLSHPNGVIGLDSVTFAADEPASVTERLASLLQREATPVAGGSELALGRGTIRVLGAKNWERLAAEAPSVPLPAMVGATLRTSSVGHTQAAFDKAGVAYRAVPGAGGKATLVVPAREACGATLTFVE